MPAITIAPLSVGGFLSAPAERAIRNADKLFLQSALSPAAAWVLSEKLEFTAMDDLYESSADFDELNAAVAARLAAAGDCVYAVSGRGIGAAQLQAILAAASEANCGVRRLVGCGYADVAAAALPFSLGDRALTCAANALPARIDPYSALCIEEIDTALRAGEVKLALGEYYPDEYPVWFAAADASGAYQPREIPLYELDRQPRYGADCCCILRAAQEGTLPRGDCDDLMRIVEVLRAPNGCPWDAEQTHESLRGALVEECYEVIDAIDREDGEAMCEELGDLLLQIVFHTSIEQDKSAFSLRDVCTGIIQKLIYRHPHVFGDVAVGNSEDVLVNWEKLKSKEKHMTSCAESMRSVPRGFPALMRAAKIQKKAARAGFDWSTAAEALYKLPEEAEELRLAIAEGDEAHISEEMGDALFAAVNVARLLKLDPEMLLHEATDKFMARFEIMEQIIMKERGAMDGMSLAQMDAFWDKAKAQMQNK